MCGNGLYEGRAGRAWDEKCQAEEEFEQRCNEAERYLNKQYGKAWGYRDGMLVFNEEACEGCDKDCDGCCNILCDLGTWGENYFSDEVQKAIIEAIDSGEV